MRRLTYARGQAMAEFAIVAPIFFLLLFGVLQLGILFGSQNGLVDSVRDTARKAATYRVDEESLSDGNVFSSICTTLQTELQGELRGKMPLFDANSTYAGGARYVPTISYAWQQNPDTSQYFLVATVATTYHYPLFIPLVGNLISPGGNGSVTLSASDQMRIENPSLTQPTSTSTHTC